MIQYADLSQGIRRFIQIAAEESHTTVEMVLSGSQKVEVVAARRTAALYMHRAGHTGSQIARWLNRDHASISNLLNGRASHKRRIGAPTRTRLERAQRLLASIPCPDLSGEWAI